MNNNVEYMSLAEAERLDALAATSELPAISATDFPTFSAHELGAMTFLALKFAVPGLITEGCSIFAGRPKLGKSWLMLGVSWAIASGGYCLGDIKCEQGDVLYLALEDNKRRLQSRIKKMLPSDATDRWPKSFEFATEWPRCDDGGLDMLRQWCRRHPNRRLIVIDVLAQFRSGRGHTEGFYELDYKAVKSLQQLASDFSVAVIVVHHVRKGMGDVDPFERVSGTMGLTGAADTTIILDRDGNGCTLYCRGRDIEEYEKAISFNRDTCRWTIQGDASEVRRTDERGSILAVLSDATEPMSPKDIEIATAMKGLNVRQLLYKMARAGDILKVKYGHYVHCDRTDLQTPGNSDNTDNSDVEGDGDSN